MGKINSNDCDVIELIPKDTAAIGRILALTHSLLYKSNRYTLKNGTAITDNTALPCHIAPSNLKVAE